MKSNRFEIKGILPIFGVVLTRLKYYLFVPVFILLISSCSTNKQVVNQTGANPQRASETLPMARDVYQEAETRYFDLLHTLLRVEFDWKKKQLNGTAELTLTPYYYSTDSLILDAKGFDLKNVSIQTGDDDQKALNPLQYSYDSLFIRIKLDKEYKRQDTISIYVEYTAKPDELEVGGSKAITSDKGLYFINPDSSEADKPTQIWTQGETEASSCWFPTIDAPNENMTQEIYMTVDNRFVTLSNGLLEFSIDNGDGTRTDYWKQNLPHAPYLVMMGVGDWKIVKEDWRGMEVSYYMEPQWEKDALRIFGNTPEMLEFYSNILGVPYPWEKYSQVITRDYVSGAMENTSAVIHGEFVHTTYRESLDEAGAEDVIAHELFHHWFGDLVTCESWSNLPLNESFATYGEYLWNEYKYGRDQADYNLHNDLKTYFGDASRGYKDMIRFDYNDKEDMFDGHSYHKGGRILHMLRKHVGDQAFFESLKVYLEDNKYQSVEIHNLRLAFEKVTGLDLNWFFNQWFLDQGHPILDVSYEYDDSLKVQAVLVRQLQDLEKSPIYRLPVWIDLYVNGETIRKEIIIDELDERFEFSVAAKPNLVNFDVENMLLAKINETKTTEEYIFQYYNCPLYFDRYNAITELAEIKENPDVAMVILEALNDKHWNIRKTAIGALDLAFESNKELVQKKLVKIVEGEDKTSVKAMAMTFLSSNYDEKNLESLYEEALKDSSYRMIAAGVKALYKVNPEKGLKLARELQKEDNLSLKMTLADVYMEHGSEADNDFFIELLDETKGFYRIYVIQKYSQYLIGRSDETVAKGLEHLAEIGTSDKIWYARYTALNVVKEFVGQFAVTEESLREEMKELKGPSNESKLQAKEVELNKVLDRKEKFQKLLDGAIANEEDEKVLKMLMRKEH